MEGNSNNDVVKPKNGKKKKGPKRMNRPGQSKRFRPNPQGTPNMSKKKRIIQEKKEKAERRQSILESLAAGMLTKEEQEKMISIKDLSKKQKKEKAPRPLETQLPCAEEDHQILSEQVAKPVVYPTHFRVLKQEKRRRKKVLVLDSEGKMRPHPDSESIPSLVAEEIANIVKNDAKEDLPDLLSNIEQMVSQDTCTEKIEESPQVEDPAEIKVKKAATLKEFVVNCEYTKRIQRDPVIQAQREKLPIFAEEQVIIESINHNDCVIICGSTGSGKTTQVPQFLYENGYGFESSGHPGLIGVTQPRRVAAISTAKRVQEEMGSLAQGLVGHQIRYDRNVDEENMRVKFMTDGILLKEIQHDFLLRKYSVIIIDEAHERNINTDVLIGLLSRIVPLRNKMAMEGNQKLTPLRWVIMSATLRVDDFVRNERLFPNQKPPVLEVQSRQFPVTDHFSKKTPVDDYLEAVYKKTCTVHTKLPPGGILVFLPGKAEIQQMVRRLKAKFSETDEPQSDSGEELEEDEEEEIPENPDEKMELDSEVLVKKVKVLPLYSLLDPSLQMKVFEGVSDEREERLIVVATNVAETSITIPGVRYVVDSGKEKVKRYNLYTGISKFVVTWISKASADQRAGRAGRTGPGHSYRLYSSAVYNDRFSQFSKPEILEIPIESTILQMKSMDISDVERFPFPTAPEESALSTAIKRLSNLCALNESGEISSIGRTMARFPVSPRFAKMLVLADQENCLSYIVAIVAGMSVGNIFTEDVREVLETSQDAKSDIQKRMHKSRQFWGDTKSDLLAMLKMICAYDYASNSLSFCEQYCLRPKSLFEVVSLRHQIHRICGNNVEETNLQLKPFTEIQRNVICQILAAGFIDQIARKWPDDEYPGAYQTMDSFELLYIHPSSYLFSAENQPLFICYQELQRTSKAYMKGITALNPVHLAALAAGSPICELSKPLLNPAPEYDQSEDVIYCYVSCTMGPHRWNLPSQRIVFPSDMKEDRIKAFARLFLEGKIVDSFKELWPLWMTRPSSLSKSTFQQSKSAQKFLRFLFTRNVDCLKTLREVVSEESEELTGLLQALLRPDQEHYQILDECLSRL